MIGAWAVLKKDFASYARSWVGLLMMSSFLLIAGIFFTLFLLGYSHLSLEASQGSYDGVEGLGLTGYVLGAFLLNLGVVVLFLTPVLTMRSFSEEKRSGTLELLFTYPLSDLEIVLGKYFSLLLQVALFILPAFIYAGVMQLFKVKIEWGIVLSGCLGFLLLGSAFVSIGLFFSSLTENQIVAASLTFTFLLAVWILEWAVRLLPEVWAVMGFFSPFMHYRDFPLGILDFSDASYFLAVTLFFLFLSQRVIETRNWKG